MDCPIDDEYIQALIRSNVADSGAIAEMTNRNFYWANIIFTARYLTVISISNSTIG